MCRRRELHVRTYTYGWGGCGVPQSSMGVSRKMGILWRKMFHSSWDSIHSMSCLSVIITGGGKLDAGGVGLVVSSQ